jgi:alpha-mannosidase
MPYQGTKIVSADGRVLENDFVQATITADGSLTLKDKQTDKEVADLLVFENVGDIANEYIFKQPEGDQAIYSTAFPHQIEVIENNALTGIVKVKQTLQIPISADERLLEEQKAVVEFRYRKAQRSKQLIPFTMETEIRLDCNSKRISFKTTVDNRSKDHRLRAIFPTGIHTDFHEADSIYEAVRRPNQVSSHWQNPTNPQHQHAYVNLHEEGFGVTVSNFGLNEYEIVDDQICLTLLRCTGELGDWGYFPTPEAQCLGQHTFEYGIELHGAANERYETYRQAQAAQVPWVSGQTTAHEGTLVATNQFVEANGETAAITALKRRRQDDLLVIRGYNLGDAPTPFVTQKESTTSCLLNLLEEEQDQPVADKLAAYEIRTVGLKE